MVLQEKRQATWLRYTNRVHPLELFVMFHDKLVEVKPCPSSYATLLLLLKNLEQISIDLSQN